jgi:hypothetical protein
MQAATQVAQPSFLHLASQNRHMTAAQFPHANSTSSCTVVDSKAEVPRKKMT